MRWIPALALLCLLVVPAFAEETKPATEPIALEGTKAMIAPPGDGFRVSKRTPAPGEWMITFTRTDDRLELQARVFPGRVGAENIAPDAVLRQALDQLGRNRDFSAGIPSWRTIDIWGLPAAEGTFQAAIDGKVARGMARVLQVDPHRWVFVWGLAKGDIKPSDMRKIRAFVESLSTAEPVFYERTFRDVEALERVVTPKPLTPPVTGADIESALACIEHGLEHRLALKDRENIRKGLLADAIGGDDRARENYLAVGNEVREALALDPNQRRIKLMKRGKHTLAAISNRMSEGYAPATQALVSANMANRPVIDGDESGPRVSALGSLIEMSLFQASLANDAEVKVDVATGTLVQDHVVNGWSTFDRTAQLGVIEAGSTWAALRHAWDTATPEARFAYRRGIAAALAPESERDAILALETPQDLKRWFAKHRSPERGRAAFLAAARMAVPERSRLFQLLGVESEGYQFGW